MCILVKSPCISELSENWNAQICCVESRYIVDQFFLNINCRGLIPPSEQEYPILGLNLLRLLVQNRIAEFHTGNLLFSFGAFG